MNQLDVNQVGGFPLTTRILDELQKAYSVFNGLGALAGNMTIIAGCTVAGSTVGDGVVYVNGEVFKFRGGNTQTKVIIKEDAEALVFESNESKTVIRNRYVTFGTGVGAMNWVDFEPLIEIKAIPINLNTRLDSIEKKLAIFQRGGVVFPWFKPVAEIPNGFQEVVDIRGRTIIGYDPTQAEFNQIGKKAGAKEKTLTAENLPEHDHFQFADETVDAGLTISDKNTPVKEGFNAGGDGNQNYRIRGTNNPATVGKTSKTGSATPFSILNPYAIAAYIEYIG
jgi:hypothetical protein